MESKGHMTISAFRRLGGGLYSFSKIIFLCSHGEWRAVTLNSTNRVTLAAEQVDTTPVLGYSKDERFNDPDTLIRYLIEKLGFVIMMDDITDRLIA